MSSEARWGPARAVPPPANTGHTAVHAEHERSSAPESVKKTAIVILRAPTARDLPLQTHATREPQTLREVDPWVTSSRGLIEEYSAQLEPSPHEPQKARKVPPVIGPAPVGSSAQPWALKALRKTLSCPQQEPPTLPGMGNALAPAAVGGSVGASSIAAELVELSCSQYEPRTLRGLYPVIRPPPVSNSVSSQPTEAMWRAEFGPLSQNDGDDTDARTREQWTLPATNERCPSGNAITAGAAEMPSARAGDGTCRGRTEPERVSDGLEAKEPRRASGAIEPQASAFVPRLSLNLAESANAVASEETTNIRVSATTQTMVVTPPRTTADTPDLDGSAPPPDRASLFRSNVAHAKSEESFVQPLPDVSATSWAVLAIIGSILLVSIGFAYFGRVEETSIAEGVLLVRGGPRPVLAQVSGTVTALDIAPGGIVQAGQSIARIDATELNARVQRDAEQLALVIAEQKRVWPVESQRYQAEVRLLQRKRGLLNGRAELKVAGIRDREGRMQQIERAARAGVASQGDALDVREAARSAEEELLLIRQQITEVDVTLSEDKKAYDVDHDRLRRELEEAKSNLAQSRKMLDLTTVSAPVGGRLESLLATQGQVVGVGTVLARIIPDGAVTSAVVFAPVKDASFLVAGLAASVEFASFPVSEFGRTTARVTRVSPDVASVEESSSLLGQSPPQAVIRVELELLPSSKLLAVYSRLRSGERLIARLNTRERRLIALIFDFLRKWYDP